MWESWQSLPSPRPANSPPVPGTRWDNGRGLALARCWALGVDGASPAPTPGEGGAVPLQRKHGGQGWPAFLFPQAVTKELERWMGVMLLW